MGLSSPPPPPPSIPGLRPCILNLIVQITQCYIPIPLTEETCNSKTHNQMITIRFNESNLIYRYCYANWDCTFIILLMYIYYLVQIIYL